SKVGVDLEIRARETAAHQAIWNRLNSEQMTTGPQQSPALLYNMNNFSVPSQVNYSFISDLYVESVRPQMQRLAVTDEDAAQRLHRELMKYVLDQAWVIPEVRPPSYIFWWPWIKNYNGEYSLSYTNRHHYGFLWYDEALKKSMGY
ncbi:MAG: hypothetical protein HY662_01995, partial [Chloroflexi bacterium]|nr:hypothetical protein [Chloroflexota bacterium]